MSVHDAINEERKEMVFARVLVPGSFKRYVAYQHWPDESTVVASFLVRDDAWNFVHSEKKGKRR